MGQQQSTAVVFDILTQLNRVQFSVFPKIFDGAEIYQRQDADSNNQRTVQKTWYSTDQTYLALAVGTTKKFGWLF